MWSVYIPSVHVCQQRACGDISSNNSALLSTEIRNRGNERRPKHKDVKIWRLFKDPLGCSLFEFGLYKLNLSHSNCHSAKLSDNTNSIWWCAFHSLHTERTSPSPSPSRTIEVIHYSLPSFFNYTFFLDYSFNFHSTTGMEVKGTWELSLVTPTQTT